MIQPPLYISYDRQQGLAFAHRLAEELQADGLVVTLDNDESILRKSWAVLFILTPTTAQAADNLHDLQLAVEFVRPIVPVMAEDVADEDWPLLLQGRSISSFTDSFARGLQKLRAQIVLARAHHDDLYRLLAQKIEFQMRRASAPDARRVDARLHELDEQIAVKRRAITDPITYLADYRRATQVGLEEERERLKWHREQARGLMRRRVVGQPPQSIDPFYKERTNETARIVNALLDDEPFAPRIVSIYGQGGAGKTALACKIMRELEKDYEQVHGLIYLSTRTGLGITLEQIYLGVAQMLGGDDEEALNLAWVDEKLDMQTRLQILFMALYEHRAILLFDNMEDLMNDAGKLTDEKLQIFLEAFLHETHRARLLVTSRQPLALMPHEERFEQIVSLDEGLPRDFGVSLLRDFDPDGTIGLKAADESQLQQLVEKTHGFPRALGAVAGILAHDPFITVGDLLQNSDMFTGNLIEKMVAAAHAKLDADARIVMQALAVYSRPVTETGIRLLLEPYLERFGLDVGAALRRLVRAHIISITASTGELVQHPLDRDESYRQIPTGLADDYNLEALERRAGNYYMEMRAPAESWRTIADLEPQLAEFEHRIRAKDYNNAARLINTMDYHYLSLWGHVRRVATMREQLVGRISDKQLDSVNCNNLGLCYASLGQYDKAIEYYEKALVIDRDMDARGDIAVTLANLGTVYSNRGDIRKAIEYQELALNVFRELGYRKNEGITVSLLGQNYHTLGQPEKAAEYYRDALTIAQEVGNRVGEGVCLSNLGNIHYDLGRPTDALDYYQQALAIAREFGDRRSEGGNLNNIGNVYSSMGDLKTALDYYEQALAIAREIGDRASEGYRLANLGDLYTLLGQYEQGIRYHQEALKLSDDIGSIAMRSTALGGLGWIYNELRLLEQALRYYEESLELVRQMGDRYGECNRLGNLGSIYTDMGLHDEALDYHQQSLAIAREIAEPTNECMRLAWLGWTYFDLGDYEQAIELLEEGLNVARRINNKRWEENNLFALAWVFTAMEHFEVARRYMDESLRLSQGLGNPSTLQSRETLVAEICMFTGQLEQALDAVERALTYDTPDVKRRSTLLLRAHIRMLLSMREAAREDYELALKYSDDILEKSPQLFSAKYSRAQALSGLALLSQGDEQMKLVEMARDGFIAARENCPANGVVQYTLQFFDQLLLVDQNGVLKTVRTALELGR